MKIVIQKSRTINGKRYVGDFPVMILCALIVVCNVPIWSRNVPEVLFYGLVLLFFASVIGCYFKPDHGKHSLILWMVLYFFMLALYKFLNISSAALSYYSAIVKSLFFVLAMAGIGDRLSARQKRLLLLAVFLSIGYTMADNMRLYLQYGASRFASLFNRERLTTNSIHTAYVYALLFFSGTLFAFFLHADRGPLRLFSLVLAILTLVFDIVVAQRAIALALAALMYSLLLLFRRKSGRNRIIVSFLVILLLFIAILLYDPILSWLAEHIGSLRLRNRISQVRVFLSSASISEAGGSLNGRFRLIVQSLETAFSSLGNLFFGAGDHRDYSIIGNHSYFIDELARYGLTGMLIWVPLIRRMLKQSTYNSATQPDTVLRRQLNALQFVYIVRGFLGGIFEATIAIQMYVFIPLVFSLLEQRYREKESGFSQKEG